MWIVCYDYVLKLFSLCYTVSMNDQQAAKGLAQLPNAPTSISWVTVVVKL